MTFFGNLKENIGRYSRFTSISPLFYRFFLLIIAVLIWLEITGGVFDRSFKSIAFRIIIYYLFIGLFFNILKLIVQFVYIRKNKLDKEVNDNYIIGTNKLFLLLGHVTFFFALLHIVGLDISSLFLTISIVASALAITFKDYVTNTLNGFIIMFSDDYKIKDYIKVGEYKGRIVNIDFQKTHVKTENGDYVYIPNNMMLNSQLTNFSKSSSKSVTFCLELQRSLFKNYEKIVKELEKHINDNFSDLILKENAINSRIENVNHDFVSFELEILVSRYTYAIDKKIKQSVTEKFVEVLGKMPHKTQ